MFDFFKKHKDILNEKAINKPEIVAEFFAETMMQDPEFRKEHKYFKEFVTESDIDLKKTIVKYVQANIAGNKDKFEKFSQEIILRYQLYELKKE